MKPGDIVTIARNIYHDEYYHGKKCTGRNQQNREDHFRIPAGTRVMVMKRISNAAMVDKFEWETLVYDGETAGSQLLICEDWVIPVLEFKVLPLG